MMFAPGCPFFNIEEASTISIAEESQIRRDGIAEF
jgi:hypothetical protein